MNPQFLTSAADPQGFPADRGLEVAVVGRSNSGKSSAINRLVGARKLARVSKTPGRTRLVNFFALAPDRRLVDLPGYGFAQVPASVRQGWQALIGAYFADRRSLAGLVITIDIRRGLGDLDRQMIAWTEDLGIPLLLLLTKADKLSRSRALDAQRKMARETPEGTAIEVFSSVDGTGVGGARAQILAWLELGKSAGSG